MAIVTTNDAHYKEIGTAIRGLNGENTQYRPEEMAPAIRSFAEAPKSSDIIVTAPTGSVVYIENQDGQQKNAGEKNGTWTFKGCDVGTWTVYASKAGQDATRTLEIIADSQLIRYYVTITYFAATITVTYPDGGICICRQGDTVYVAPDTTGRHAFTVYSPGDWVISSEKGNDSYMQTVTIAEDGQSESVSLVVYYAPGDIRESFTGGWEKTYGGDFTVTFASEYMRLYNTKVNYGIIATNNMLAMDKLSSLKIRTKKISAQETYWALAIRIYSQKPTSNTITPAAYAFFDNSGNSEQTVSLSVEELTGSYYVAVYTVGISTFDVFEIWAE